MGISTFGGGKTTAKNGFKLLDSDMHIVEPPDVGQLRQAL